MFGFKTREQRAQERYKDYSKKRTEEERFEKFQEELSLINKQRNKSEIILKEIYRRHGISICYPGSSITIDTGYLEDEVIDELCVFNEDERKSLHKWAKAYKDCEQLSIMKVEEYKNERDANS